MRIKKENIKNINLIVGFFLAFSGYYVMLIVMINLLPGLESRNLTIPLRLIIVVSIGFIFLLQPRVKLQKGLVFFLLFATAYLTRIFIEYLDYNSMFHIPVIEFFLYFISFVLIPLVLISQFRLSEHNYNKIFLAVIAGTTILSALTFFFYKGIIGLVGRISSAGSLGESFISPLALSYCSVLGIGVGIAYLITNKVGIRKKLFIYSTIALSFIPFYLGASRGSILALSFPFAFYFFFTEGIKKRCTLLFSIVILSIVMAALTEYLGTGVFDRFMNIQRDIATGSSSVVRIDIWKYSLQQFLEHPLLGNSLECDQFNFYPHNILLEVLITTGIIGFIPFVLFLYNIFTKMRLIVKQHSEYFWICTIFLQAFTQNMFSGGIYSAGWLAIGGGMILGFKFDKLQDRNVRENR